MQPIATLPCMIADTKPTIAIGMQNAKIIQPCAAVSAAISPNTFSLIIVINATTKPYKPCVDGMTCKIMVLPNLSGCLPSNAAEACPALPTPIAEPMPDTITAIAAPMMA